MDRIISISKARSCESKTWRTVALKWSEFVAQLSKPKRAKVSMEQFANLSPKDKKKVKDGPGYVGGVFTTERRKSDTVLSQEFVRLDLDNIESSDIIRVFDSIESFGIAYVVHSTISYTTSQPKLRVLFPLDRKIDADMYPPIARRVAERVGMQYIDPTCFRVNQLMFYPKVLSDGEYIWRASEGPFLCADDVLATYNDWRSYTEWPMCETEKPKGHSRQHQQDPREKTGIVGVVCRLYTIADVIEKYLSDKYEPTDDPNLYNLINGSGIPGLRVYDDGLFAYSYHSTDPIEGHVVNAFDMIRVWEFSHLDDNPFVYGGAGVEGVEGGSEPLKSFKACCEFFKTDDLVKVELDKAKKESLKADFGLAVAEELKLDDNGKLYKTIQNASVVIAKDAEIAGAFGYDTFMNRMLVYRRLPWDHADVENRDGEREFCDADYAGFYDFFEQKYKFKDRKSIDSALHLHMHKNSKDKLKEYLSGLTWDGVLRAETILVDYLGAEDDEKGYTRFATKLWLTGAVKRAIERGSKFDLMLVLVGPQGVGKSKFLSGLAKGWVAENFNTFRGVEAKENLQGAWIVDVGELAAFSSATLELAKNFLTTQEDGYRVPYNRVKSYFKRSCVFAGSTNHDEFLEDLTGDRRFLPVVVGENKPTKDFMRVDEEIDQIWAEVVLWYKAGERTYYTYNDPQYEMITEKQESHRRRHKYEDVVLEFLDKLVPVDWYKWSEIERKNFWAGCHQGAIPDLAPRDRIAAKEIWFEAIGGDYIKLDDRTLRDINAIIKRTGEWKKHTIRVNYLGKHVNGWVRP